jgi:hypothetical protein
MLASLLQSFGFRGRLSLLGLLCLTSRAAAQAPPAGAAPATTGDEKAACIAAFDQAQLDRAASRLLASQKQLLECSRPACGMALMSECTQMYTDVERALPSVVPSPSPSTPPRSPSLSPVLGPASATGASAEPGAGGVPVMTYVLGGLSVVGFGTFGTLRIIANSDFDTLKKGCAPSCPESDVSNLKQKFLFSNVALGVGAGAAVGAALWYVLDAPNAGVEAGAAHLSIEPARSGAMATARGTF